MARGHVRKRGKSWSVVVELERDPDSNRRRQKWLSGYRSQRDAERALAETLTSLDRGTFITPSKQTLRQFVEEDFLPTLRSVVRPATYHSYERNLRLHVLPALGGRRLLDIDAAALSALYGRLITDGRKDHAAGTPLSPRTVAYIASIVGRVFHQALDWDRIARNPADRARPPKATGSLRQRVEMTTWTGSEVAQFLSKCQEVSDPHYAAWLTLATTGLRRGELLGLRWADLDLDSCRASIRQTLIVVVVDGRHEAQFGTPKTEHGRRQLALDATTVAALRSHRAAQAERRLAAGELYQDHDLVFAQHDGRPLHPERFSRSFDQRVARHGLRRIRLHDLRHTHATLALQTGVHPRVVQERLGHANIGITLGTYSHVTPAMDASAADTIAAAIFGAPASG
jgi:integrase